MLTLNNKQTCASLEPNYQPPVPFVVVQKRHHTRIHFVGKFSMLLWQQVGVVRSIMGVVGMKAVMAIRSQLVWITKMGNVHVSRKPWSKFMNADNQHLVSPRPLTFWINSFAMTIRIGSQQKKQCLRVMASGGGGAPAIGIDLGTTNSCVAVWKHDRIEIIANDQGNRTTPSCVAFTNTQRLVGDAAKNQIAKNPANTIFNAKRLIGRRFGDDKVQEEIKLLPFKVIKWSKDMPRVVVTHKHLEQQFSMEEISSMVLGKMKEVAEAYIGQPVKNAVITVPAYFNDGQRRATKDAATIAGLNVLRMINEPTAAAIAYGIDNMLGITGKRNVVVFDLGGGTFDVSVLTIDEAGKFKVKGVAGDSHLGGEDFDNRLVDYCVEEFKRKHDMDLTGNKKALGRLKVACEIVKRSLSFSTEASIELELLHQGIDFSKKITRAKFEKLNMRFFKRCIEELESCLEEADMSKPSIDEVILVGGSTRIPKVQSMLKEFFDGKDLCKNINPDEAVAYGAALMAAKLGGETRKNLNEFTVSDVTPLSLGIDTNGDIMSVVIPRNTPIPAKETETFITIADKQSIVEMPVYQGERSKSTDNYLLGSFTVSGIPPAPKGAARIDTCFEIDANGILTVTSKVVSTGKTKSLTVRNIRGRLSKKEIEKMVKDAEKFKCEDQAFKRKAEAYNALEDCIYRFKKKIKRNENDVPQKELKNMNCMIDDTKEWLSNNKVADVDEINHKKDQLETLIGIAFSD
ncbi:hypothetical protein LXL04_019219 [Taraxacum kok-saghyz]